MALIEIKNQVQRDAIPIQVNRTNVFDEIIKFGENNLAPQVFMQLARTVGNHRAILNSKTRYVGGNSYATEDKKTEDFIKRVNNEGLSLKSVCDRAIFDYFGIGNAYYEIVTDSRKSFLQLYHIDATKGRLHKDKENIIFNEDWAQRDTKKDVVLPIYPNFKIDEQNNKLRRSVVWIKSYEPEFINGIPDWFAGLRTVSISGLVDISNEAELKNGHSISGMLFIPGVGTGEDLEAAEKSITDNQTGADNHGKILVGTYENGEGTAKPELIDFRKSIDGNFLDLKSATNDQLIMVHAWYRSLTQIQDSTGFDTNRILNEYRVALATTIQPYQEFFNGIMNGILKDFGYQEITSVNKSPVDAVQQEDMLFVWEMREKLGLEFNKEDPAQQKLIYEIK